MRITVDTNVLIRAVVRDDEAQAGLATDRLRQADLIAVTTPTLCEFVWVLRRVYGFATNDIARAVRALLETRNVAVDRPVAEAGLAMLEAGGDFADGAIAHEGGELGGEVFVSFDRRAVRLLAAQARPASLLA
ncbi:type II toxin-antitoxin system VapC family toxin [Marinivivus vitaminiproducens]|uniref:type II toxin-antitoxin system VapC family toxin n=1 Tax=Marinivivus vitaminiproducens TaxID=3035935 RepID=UPI00279DDAFB|nr:type II toxin-antitoxin system VapC family toxin [Geminicoccaceae bacterium SCSIO 64248]